VEQFRKEQEQFDELALRIQETSHKLTSERDKVLEEKAVFDEEKDRLDRFKHDVDVERAILQSEFSKLEEFEHELTHRENMLKMLQFNHDKRGLGIAGLLPSYTSCPGLKNPMQQQFTSEPMQQQEAEGSVWKEQTPDSGNRQQQFPNTPQRFNYEEYMREL
jgi:hypothetical protein